MKTVQGSAPPRTIAFLVAALALIACSKSKSASQGDSCVDSLSSWRKACGASPLELHNLLGPYDELSEDGPKSWCADLKAGKNGSNIALCEPLFGCIAAKSSCEAIETSVDAECRTSLIACVGHGP
jgi:hypothetical protein